MLAFRRGESISLTDPGLQKLPRNRQSCPAASPCPVHRAVPTPAPAPRCSDSRGARLVPPGCAPAPADVGDAQTSAPLANPEGGRQLPFAKKLPNDPASWLEPLYNCDARASHAESQNCHRSLCKPIFTSLSVAHQRRTRKLQTQYVNLGLLSREKKK